MLKVCLIFSYCVLIILRILYYVTWNFRIVEGLLKNEINYFEFLWVMVVNGGSYFGVV